MKNRIKINESQLRNLIAKTVKRALYEQGSPQTLTDELQNIANTLRGVQDQAEEYASNTDIPSQIRFAINCLDDLTEWCKQKNLNADISNGYADFSYDRHIEDYQP